MRGLFSWVGFKQIAVPFDRAARAYGETKYPLVKMIRFAFDGVISFSSRPLRILMHLGFFIAVASVIAGIWALYLKFSGGYVVRGWTSILLINAFVFGSQLVVLGFIGEYIARIYDEVKGRPLYFVKESIGVQAAQRANQHGNYKNVG